jgi:hypothetical protein
MRVYLPATLTTLAELAKRGELESAGLTAYAVTPALREWYTEGDEEELEYAALTEAARAALRLLGADPLPPRRRVVLAADVPDCAATPIGSPFSQSIGVPPASVRLEFTVPLAAIAAIHLDDPAAESVVGAAAVVVGAADTGDDDAQFTVDGVEDYDLMWYGTQELPELLR